MPFDGNGNWTSNFSAVADRNANIKIEASRFDNILLADIAQSFETCLTKDMQVKPQQNFDANNFRIINVADPTTGSDAVNLSTLNTKDGTAVHKAGTETITGNKTFSGTITSSGTNTWSGSNTFSGSVSLGALATATSPSASDSSTKVATTAWVNTVGNNVMHLTGNESVSGNKTFSGQVINAKSSPYLILQDTSVTKGTNPSNTRTSTLVFNPNTNSTSSADCMGRVHCQVKANGDVEVSMFAHRNIASDTTSAALTVTNKLDGTKTATAPTPTSPTDSSTNIATTAWVKSSVFGIPDYSKRVTVTSPYTPTQNGILRVFQNGGSPTAWITTMVGSTELVLARAESTDSSTGTQTVWCFVESGREYTFGKNAGTLTGIFIPFK